MIMKIQDFTVTERPGERTRAKPNGLRINMTRDYAADLVRRLVEQLADENKGEVDVSMFGEIA
jgi:hypothetical protein